MRSLGSEHVYDVPTRYRRWYRPDPSATSDFRNKKADFKNEVGFFPLTEILLRTGCDILVKE